MSSPGSRRISTFTPRPNGEDVSDVPLGVSDGEEVTDVSKRYPSRKDLENALLESRESEARLQRIIEDHKRGEDLAAGEKLLLEMVTSGHSTPGILDALCRFVESATSGCFCSVVLVDPTGTRLEHGAAPSLPASFMTSIIGRPVNAESGPCAMAAYLNEQVIAADLTTRDTVGGVRVVPNGFGARDASVLVNAYHVRGGRGLRRVRDLLRGTQNAHATGPGPYRPIHAHREHHGRTRTISNLAHACSQ